MGRVFRSAFNKKLFFWGFIPAIQRNEVPLKKADLFLSPEYLTRDLEKNMG
jgi:hypothetical protein